MTRSPVSVDIPSLLHLAETARGAGGYERGARLAQQAADMAVRQGNKRLQARALRLLANQLIKLGEYERAARSADLAISLLETLGDEAGICETRTFQAQAYSALGLQEEALTALGGGLELAQRLGDNLLLFWTLNRIGTSHCDMADWAQAEPFLRHAHELATGEDLGDEATFCILNNLASHAQGYVKALRALDDFPRAEAELRSGLIYARQAVDAARAVAHPFRKAISLGNLGMLLGLAGDFDAAAAQMDRALELSATHGYRPLELDALNDTGELFLLRGDLPAAVARFAEVLQRASQANEPYVILLAHQQLSAAHERIGDYQSALRHYRDYHRIERLMHSEVANHRAKLLTHRFELHNAQLAADKARLEARLAMLRSHELEAEKQALQMRATELGRDANTDPLTGLWNRRHMDEQFPGLFRHAQETGRPLCVAIGDLDRFKNVNDRFGHAAGDQVLRQLAAILRGGCRPGDMVARMGGEEFFLALIDTEFPAARATCERLRRAVEHYPWHDISPGLAVTISFGVGEATDVGDHHQLLARADGSMYAAKRAGRNRVEPVAGQLARAEVKLRDPVLGSPAG
ncbi:MAG: hypothetical protein DLM59_05425 [Pseudonocardiales bacterium]|nr:MAG: hypothetical protein DLM59_05425 [Pseudonocardiales bacterium]